jgi:hypothetical protein
MAVSESDEPPWAVVDAGVSKNVLFQSVPFLRIAEPQVTANVTPKPAVAWTSRSLRCRTRYTAIVGRTTIGVSLTPIASRVFRTWMSVGWLGVAWRRSAGRSAASGRVLGLVECL